MSRRLGGILLVSTATFMLVLATATSKGLTDDCLACMCWASSNCTMPDPACKLFSWGEVCGPWAITQPYWVDGGSILDDFYTCVQDWQCNENTVRAYLKRYVTDANAKCESYARTHAGGPLGAWNDNTLPYWYSVKECLDYAIFTPPSV